MRKSRLLLLWVMVLAGAFATFAPNGANAIPTDQWGPGEGNSWVFSFAETTLDPFDRVEAVIVSGAEFDAPIDGKWFGSSYLPSSAMASGSPTNRLEVTLSFLGDPPTSASGPVVIDFFAYNGSTLVESFRFNDLINWQWVVLSTNSPGEHCPSPVPEPGTMLLLGSGLVSFAVLRNRFKG